MSQKQKNPQIKVINSLLEDWKNVDLNVDLLLRGPIAGKSEAGKEVAFLVENLPERQRALIQILRRDNYYRNLNRNTLKILHWIVGAAREAFKENETETALELTLAWEEKMQQIFQECYPNEREFRSMILDAVSKMRMVAMPGFPNRGVGGISLLGPGQQDEEDWING